VHREAEQAASKSEAVSCLVEQICPPPDPREHDLLYMQLLTDLRQVHATGCPAIDVLLAGLAHDCIQAMRCRQAIERLQRMAFIEPREQEAYERSRQAHADDFAIKLLLTQSQQSLPFECPPEIAARFAIIVDDLLQQYVLDFYEEALSPEEIEELPDSIRAEYDRRLPLWHKIKPARAALAVQSHVAALLAGSESPTDAERQALDALMPELDEVQLYRKHSDFAELAKRKTERDQFVALCDNTEKIKRLALIDGYLRQIERAIHATLKTLGKTAKPRSG